MAMTPSTMAELGTPAPHFNLPDADGTVISMSDFADKKALVVMFICNHCPFVKHIADRMAEFGRNAQEMGAAVVAIQPNDILNYPDDAPGKMKQEIGLRGYTFPYLHDEEQDVAHAYRAACTPDFFVYDEQRLLRYRGQFDGSRPGNDVPVTGEDLMHALEKVLAGEEIPAGEQQPSIGCNIKWKPGNEPSYA